MTALRRVALLIFLLTCVLVAACDEESAHAASTSGPKVDAMSLVEQLGKEHARRGGTLLSEYGPSAKRKSQQAQELYRELVGDTTPEFTIAVWLIFDNDGKVTAVEANRTVTGDAGVQRHIRKDALLAIRAALVEMQWPPRFSGLQVPVTLLLGGSN